MKDARQKFAKGRVHIRPRIYLVIDALFTSYWLARWLSWPSMQSLSLCHVHRNSQKCSSDTTVGSDALEEGDDNEGLDKCVYMHTNTKWQTLAVKMSPCIGRYPHIFQCTLKRQLTQKPNSCPILRKCMSLTDTSLWTMCPVSTAAQLPYRHISLSDHQIKHMVSVECDSGANVLCVCRVDALLWRQTLQQLKELNKKIVETAARHGEFIPKATTRRDNMGTSADSSGTREAADASTKPSNL